VLRLNILLKIPTAYNSGLAALKRPPSRHPLAAIFQVFIVDFLQFFLTYFFIVGFVVAIPTKCNQIRNIIAFVLLFFAEV